MAIIGASLFIGAAESPGLEIRQVPATAKFADPNYQIWGASMVEGDDGRFHLFYSRWPNALGHRAWVSHSEIAHAVSEQPDGPWQRSDTPLIDVGDENAHDAIMVSNPSVAQRPEGGYLMVYKAVAKNRPGPRYGPVVHLTATSDSPAGPFTKQNKPVFTAENSEFPAEDPYIWHQNDRYFAIVKDMRGNFTHAEQSLALFESRNGFDWAVSKNPLVSRLEIPWAGREPQQVSALERPQLWLRNGKPEILFCAIAVDRKRTETFNLAIYLAPDP